MAKTILSNKQQALLNLISKQKDLISSFYLSGGTALSEYYLHHRLSEDLDFFSLEEVDPLSIQINLKNIQIKAGIKKIDFQQSFNWKFKDLIKKARAKFDSAIDPIQMGQQLLKVTEVLDYPTMIIQLPEKEWQDFWLQEAQNLKKEVLQ